MKCQQEFLFLLFAGVAELPRLCCCERACRTECEQRTIFAWSDFLMLFYQHRYMQVGCGFDTCAYNVRYCGMGGSKFLFSSKMVAVRFVPM